MDKRVLQVDNAMNTTLTIDLIILVLPCVKLMKDLSTFYWARASPSLTSKIPLLKQMLGPSNSLKNICQEVWRTHFCSILGLVKLSAS